MKKFTFLMSLLSSVLVLTGCGESSSSNSTENSTTVSEEEHSLIHHEKVSPTCEDDGCDEYYECSTCGRLFSDENGENEIDKVPLLEALGHDLVHFDAVVGTCTDVGIDEYYKCSRCDKIFEDPNGIVELKEIPVTGLKHTLVHHDSKPYTCSEDGNDEYWTCSVCEKIFTDEDGKNEVPFIPTIPASGHVYTSYYKDDEGHTKCCIYCGVITGEKEAHKYTDWEIDSYPTKLSYIEDEDFDLTGLVATATCECGQEKDISSEVSVTDGTALAYGTKKVTLKYGEITKEVEIFVSEKERSAVATSSDLIMEGDDIYWTFTFTNVGYTVDDYLFYDDNEEVIFAHEGEIKNGIASFKIKVTDYSVRSYYPHLKLRGKVYAGGGSDAGDIKGEGLAYPNGKFFVKGSKTYALEESWSMPTLKVYEKQTVERVNTTLVSKDDKIYWSFNFKVIGYDFDATTFTIFDSTNWSYNFGKEGTTLENNINVSFMIDVTSWNNGTYWPHLKVNDTLWLGDESENGDIKGETDVNDTVIQTIELGDKKYQIVAEWSMPTLKVSDKN